MSLDSYKDMVDELFRKKSTVVIGNSTLLHAECVIKKIFESAEKNIRILSGTFSEFFCKRLEGTLEIAAKKLNEKNGIIQIITIDEENTDELAGHFKGINRRIGRDIIDYIPAKFSGKSEMITHVIVADDSMYRKESPHPKFASNLQKAPIEARVCANGQEDAKALSCYFDDIWNGLAS